MNNNSRHIIITGTFCSLNKGDAAMRIALASALRKAMPGCRVTVTTPYPELDASAYTSNEIVACSRRHPRKATSLILRAMCWSAAKKVFKKDLSFLLNQELLVYRDSDVIVDLSGDGLTEEYGTRCLLSHLVPIVLGKLLAKPVFVCAQTIGPLHKTGFICKSILKWADAVSAREEISFDYLQKNGLCSPSLSLVADLAFLLEPSPASKARKQLEAEGVPFDKPLIGFSLSRLPGHVFSIAGSRKPAHLETEMAAVFDRVVQMGARPVLISHTTGPGLRRDDRHAALRVIELMNDPSGATVLKGDYSAEDTKAIIAQMDMFVGVRMHSCIAAMSTYVPTVCIAYGPKAYGIMRLAGQEKWVVDIRQVTADGLFEVIKQAWESRSDTKLSLQTHIPHVLAMARHNVEIIQQLLGCECAADSTTTQSVSPI